MSPIQVILGPVTGLEGRLTSELQIRAAGRKRRLENGGASARPFGTLSLCPSDPKRLWAVDLSPAERATLDSAFRRDPELWVDVGYAFSGLADLGVQGVFVRSLVKRLRRAGPRVPPALAVLPAAGDALEDAGWPM